MDLLKQFRDYLKASAAAYNTRKNYSSDLSTFVDYLGIQGQYFSLLTLPFVLSSETLENYKYWLLKSNPPATVNRRLAAVRKFLRFAISTRLIEEHEGGQVTNTSPTSRDKNQYLLEKFRKHLISHGNTTNTVKGYVSDVKYYLGLRNDAAQSPASERRRKHSIKKFQDWRKERTISETTSTPSTSNSHIRPASKMLIGIGTFALIASAYFLVHQFCSQKVYTAINTTIFSRCNISAITKNGRPSALQTIVSETPPAQKISSSFNARQVPILQESSTSPIIRVVQSLISLVSGSIAHMNTNNTLPWFKPHLIDPTQTNSDNSSSVVLGTSHETIVSTREIANLLKSWLVPAGLIDPLVKR